MTRPPETLVTVGDRLAFISLLVLAVVLPMEIRAPLVHAGPVGITNVEACLYLVLVFAALSWWRRGGAALPGARPVYFAVGAWVAANVASAIGADNASIAMRFALRGAAACGLVCASAVVVTSRRRLIALLVALAAGGMVSAIAGLLEIWSPSIRESLMPFKEQRSLVGGFLRASGTFDFANTASMYWEATLPLFVMAAAFAVWRGSRVAAALLVVAAMTMAMTLVLTLSRAGFVTAVACLASLGLLSLRTFKSARVPAAATLATLIVGLFAATGAGSPLALRLQSDHLPTWYRTEYRIEPARLEMEAGGTASLSITLRNVGLVRWRASGAEPVTLSHFWQGPDDSTDLIPSGRRANLPHDVEVGEEVTLEAPVRAPERPGRYMLRWDLAQEYVTWFSALGVPTGDVSVTVTPARVARPPAVRGRDVVAAPEERPTRRALWGVAWRLWMSRPLLGIGPDSFRRAYGAELGLKRPDTRIHANSLYVETLVTLGLAGAAALVFLMVTIALTVSRRWNALAGTGRMLLAGPAIGLTAFFVHGLVDYFVIFASTSLLFWLYVGLLALPEEVFRA